MLSDRPASLGPPVPASWSVLRQLPADTLAGFAFGDATLLGGALGLVDWHLCGLLSETLASGRFAAATGERLLVPTVGQLRAKQLIVFGLGTTMGCAELALEQVLAAAKQALQALGSRQVGVLLPAAAAPAPHSWHAQAQWCAARVRHCFGQPQQSFVPAAFLAAPADSVAPSRRA